MDSTCQSGEEAERFAQAAKTPGWRWVTPRRPVNWRPRRAMWLARRRRVTMSCRRGPVADTTLALLARHATWPGQSGGVGLGVGPQAAIASRTDGGSPPPVEPQPRPQPSGRPRAVAIRLTALPSPITGERRRCRSTHSSQEKRPHACPHSDRQFMGKGSAADPCSSWHALLLMGINEPPDVVEA